MAELINNTNKFLEETLKNFGLQEGENLLCFKCTQKFNLFYEKLFICRFLFDSIKKGIEHHKTWLNDNKELIARKITANEIPRMITNFEGIIEYKDLITILVYDFFINYLAEMIMDILRNNHNFLKNIELIDYRGYEIINRLNDDPNLIIEDLINVFLYGKKEEGNLRTNPDFWIKILNDIKIKLTKEEISFWKTIHIRRNAYSHLYIKQQWKDLSKNLSNIDFNFWLYGLLFLSYKIECRICDIYKFKVNEYKFNFSGEFIYDLEKLYLFK